MTASTIGSDVVSIDGENAETSQKRPVHSKTKQSLPRTAILACESSSVLGLSEILEVEFESEDIIDAIV